MIRGMSSRSFAISPSRFFSDAFSGDPGPYARTGSFTGGGTRRVPANPASGTVPGAGADGPATGLVTGAGLALVRRGFASRTGIGSGR
jgi:hypothetical protein